LAVPDRALVVRWCGVLLMLHTDDQWDDSNCYARNGEGNIQ
jgi:hypothetical protein